MAYAVKYRGEFSDVFGYDRTEGNLITGWDNDGYDTLTTSDTEITSAITDGSAYAYTYKANDAFAILSGDSVIVTINLTLNSGDAPEVYLYKAGSGVVSNVEAIAEGANTIKLTATESGDVFVTIWNGTASNWSSGEISVVNEQLHDWKIEILEDDFAGEVTTMTMAGDPLRIEWPSTSDNVFEQNIRGSVAEISVYCTTDFQYADLFAVDNLTYKVNIYNDTDLFWTGWVTANTWTEPYVVIPYVVTISATDGLGLLKDTYFTDLTMTRRTGAKLIYDIVALLGFDQFTEYVNIFDGAMDDDVDDSPILQSEFYTWVFEGMTNYEVLTEILKTFNAAIIQQWGQLIIYRYLELTDATMYGRTFTDATTKTAITYTPLQKINRAGDASNFLDAGRGTITVVPGMSKLYITQDLGLRESALQNYEFNFDDFDTGEIDGWTPSDGGVVSLSPFFDSYGEVNGIVLNVPETGPGPGEYIYQTLAGGVTGGKIVVRFDYGFINSNSSNVLASMFSNFAGTTFNAVNITAPPGWSGWTSVEGSLSSVSGDVTIKLYNGVNGDGYIKSVFRNIEVVFTDNNYRTYESVNYEVDAAAHGQIGELEYKLGDFSPVVKNAKLQYNGMITTGGDKTDGWSTRGGSENDYIAELIGGEIGNQFSRQRQLLDISLHEQNSDFLYVFGRFEDSLNQYLAVNRKFIAVRAIYNVKNRIWDLTLIELI